MMLQNKEIPFEKIAELLNSFLNLKSLKDRYTVKVPELPDFCAELNKKILQEKNIFEKNILLKENLKKYFTKDINDNNKITLVNYIINTWGGIQKLRAGERQNLIFNDISSPKSKDIIISENAYISSRSKVFSFLNPKKYVICDSRVIFSLNWLLFIARTEKQLIQFKQLEIRNRVCKSYNLLYLFEKNNMQAACTIDNYDDYLDFIKTLTDEIKKTDKKWKLYFTEMLLFQIADDLVYGLPFLVRELLLKNNPDFSFENALEFLKKKNPK